MEDGAYKWTDPITEGAHGEGLARAQNKTKKSALNIAVGLYKDDDNDADDGDLEPVVLFEGVK
jgi:hypothetical protein